MDKKFLLDNLKTIIWVLSLFVAASFWVFSINQIPQRVDRMEIELSSLKNDIAHMKADISKNGLKSDIMIDDIKLIKQVVVQTHH